MDGNAAPSRPDSLAWVRVRCPAAKVYVIDRVVTRPGRAREFVDRYLAEYAPGAKDRGMTWTASGVPLIWFDDDSNTVTISLGAGGTAGLVEMTWKAVPTRASERGGPRSAGSSESRTPNHGVGGRRRRYALRCLRSPD